MARLLPSFGTKALDTDTAANRRWAATPRRVTMAGQPVWNPWSTEKAVRDGTERDIWTWRAIHALALAVSRLPVVLRDGDPWNGKLLQASDDPILDILNRRANGMFVGKLFRYRIVWQLTLSKPGVFIERVVSRRGNLIAMNLLPMDITKLVPDALGRIDHLRIDMPDGTKIDLPPDDICWLRWPHPTDTFSGMTPLEALGITIDTSVAGRLYNRNFLARDGRPAGLVAIKGHMSDEELDELSARFSGRGNTGEIAFIEDPSPEGESFQWQDFGSTPRDMAYDKLRAATKDEILVGIGTPESIAGNASGKTFANADAEREGFYTDGVMPTAEVLSDALTPWTADGEDGQNILGYDVSGIAVLGRHQRERDAFMLTEFIAGAITEDEYRLATGREELTDEQRQQIADRKPAAPGAPPGGGGFGEAPEMVGPQRQPLEVVKDDAGGKAPPRASRGRWVAAT